MISTLAAWLHPLLGDHVDWKQVFLVGMSPVFVLAFLLEFAVERQRGRSAKFHWREIWANLALGAGYQVAEAVMWLAFTGAVFAAVYRHRLFDIPVDGWTIVPIFVLVELCYYAFHRASHRVRWFWSAHVPHHTGEHMNFTTAMRQSLLNAFVGIYVFYLPPVWLGVPPAVVMFLLAVDLAYQYFVHTEVIGRLPRWYEYVFDTPSNHRVHHGRNARYIDRNYGGVLIVFDRWFGTYVEEDEPVDYGITRQIRSHNPLVLNLHEFVDLWRDVLAPGPLWQRLRHLWMPPEWERSGHAPVHTWTVERVGAGPASPALAAEAAPTSTDDLPQRAAAAR
jgi:sterol desaturase/sphingolipid hydroxylase (fatty acid hydroxylase superfamily)